MLSREDYIRYSLETNLFFLRLAKEHALFAAVSLPPRDMQISCQLIGLKNNAEMLLGNAVTLSQGVISAEVLSSEEIVTNLTLQAETKTQFLTGIPINMNITKMELALRPGGTQIQNPMLFQMVSMLNQRSIMALNTAISSTEKLLTDIKNCNAFSFLYPSLIEHVLAETRFFTMLLMKLQNMEDIESIKGAITQELNFNWNEIMKEHAQFIRGYLDPSEIKLFETADAFVKEFDRIEMGSRELCEQPNLSPEVIRESLMATKNLRDFKKQSTEGILACKIQSVIQPLFADHVTREANHYLRLLNSQRSMS